MLRQVKLEKLLARRLREVAQDKGLPLSHVADRAGMSRSYFWLLLDARSSATLDAVQRLAEVFGVDPIALLTGREADVGRIDISGSAKEPIAAQPNPTPLSRGKRKKG
jgi:transcriptional regulator with XRE-family HTH domain